MRRVLLLLVGPLVATCGSGDAPRGTAAITIVDGGPLVGVDVVFHHPDGRVLAHAVTGADGKASATVEAGALVTVARLLYGMQYEWRLTTIAGVEPGDDLLLDWTPTESWGQLVGSAQVTYPGTFAGADQYSVDLGCTGSAWSYVPDPTTVSLYSTCGASVDAIAIAHSAGSGMVGWATAAGVAVTGTEPDRTAEVTLGAWRSDLGTMAVTLQNPPAGATFTLAQLQPRRNGRLWHASTGDATSLPAAAALSLPFARDFWTSGRLLVSVLHDQDGFEAGAFVENEAPLASREVDLATAIPPRLSGLEVVETEGGHRASWTRAASDAGLDATILGAAWSDAGGMHDWTVVLPPCCTAFDFPELPAALAPFLPEAGTALAGAAVRSLDVSTAASYRAFRAGHLGFLELYPDSGPWTVRQTSTSAVP